MDYNEIRIHYAANNTVSSDARWMNIASGVLRFKAARRVNISDSIISVGESEEILRDISAHKNDSMSPTDIFTRPDVISQSSYFAVCSPDLVGPSCASDGRKRRASISFEQGTDDTPKRVKGTSFARSKKGLNPAFKNPIAGYLKARKTFASRKTPKSQTAAQATVLVPVTASPKRLQNKGQQSRLPDSDTDDLQAPSTTDCIDETSFIENSSTSTVRIGLGLPYPTHSLDDDASPRAQHPPGNQEQFQMRGASLIQTSMEDPERLDCISYVDFEADEVIIGTGRVLPPQDDTSHTGRTTTATPSKIEIYAEVSSPLVQKSQRRLNSIIDLVSSPEENPLCVTRRDVLGPVSSPILEAQHLERTSQKDRDSRRQEVLSLPRRLMCTNHMLESRPFKSFLPKYLMELAEKFELQNHFRPVAAPASLRNDERGYWSLRMSVMDVLEVARSRKLPLTSSQWSDRRFMMRQEHFLSNMVSLKESDDALKRLIYADVDPETYVPWTLAEFRGFWSYLGELVQKGRAGYDVHATLRYQGTAGESVKVEVKLYGYSEALSHLWLLLYGVSGALTASMPLQWHLPGKGPIITMSGQLKRGGRLGRWIAKETGVHGSWGIEANWDGLSSVLSARANKEGSTNAS